jgi:hypothetical protein
VWRFPAKVIAEFQERSRVQSHLRITGHVDEATAVDLRRLLGSLGLFNAGVPSGSIATAAE